MLYACKGVVHGNTVIADEEIIGNDGQTVVITILDSPKKNKPQEIDWESLKAPTERAKNSDEFVRGLRDNDRF